MAKKINLTHLEKVDYDAKNDCFFSVLTTGEILHLDYELIPFEGKRYVEGLECNYMKIHSVADSGDREVEDWEKWQFSEGLLNEIAKRVAELATEQYPERWYKGSKEEEDDDAESAYLDSIRYD